MTGVQTCALPISMPAAAMPVLGIASGAMSGIFTVGGGPVVVPALDRKSDG